MERPVRLLLEGCFVLWLEFGVGPPLHGDRCLASLSHHDFEHVGIRLLLNICRFFAVLVLLWRDLSRCIRIDLRSFLEDAHPFAQLRGCCQGFY